MANSVDPDETARYEPSHQDLHCLQNHLYEMVKLKHREASVAQSDACPTGDQNAASSIPAGSGNILSWRLIMKYFLRSFSPFFTDT